MRWACLCKALWAKDYKCNNSNQDGFWGSNTEQCLCRHLQEGAVISRFIELLSSSIVAGAEVNNLPVFFLTFVHPCETSLIPA